MSGEPNGTEIEIYQSKRFEKALRKMSDEVLQYVEDEIDKIIDDPEIGIQKKGDLNYLWVHKFKVDSQQLLLGYSWKAQVLELYLLNIGPHENFYRDAKSRRSADLKLIR